MKPISNFCRGLGLWLALVFAVVRVEAANPPGFGLTAYDTTNVFFVNTPITTILDLTNASGTNVLNTFVTNAFSGPVAFLGYTNLLGDTNTLTANLTAETNLDNDTLIFNFQDFTNTGEIVIAFVWQPLTSSPLTNSIEAFSPDANMTNTVSTNLVYGSIYSVAANLGLTLGIVSPAAITNDWVITNDAVTLAVTLTNTGPVAVPGVLLTNALPPGVIVRGATASFSTVSNNLIFNVGTLGSGGAVRYQITLDATNVGALPWSAGAGAPGLYDPGFLPQTDTNWFATNYLPATLAVGTNSGQIVNPQNGLIEQTIVVANNGAGTVPAVRVVVAGLTNQLYNASGTNYGYNASVTNLGRPFVVYPVALAPGGRVSLRLQYAPRLPFAFTNGQLEAYAVPAAVLNYAPPLSPLQSFAYATNSPNFYRIQSLPDGDVLLEFTNSNVGRSYTVVYSDNPLFSPAQIALPVVVPSAANRIQWLDYGPPATVSAPTNSSGRFYRVLLNP